MLSFKLDNISRSYEENKTAPFCQAWPVLSCGVCVSVCVCVCVSVTFGHSVKTNKYIFKIFSPSGSHTILVFPQQTAWIYSDGNPPNGGVECTWGRQKSRLWGNIWPHCVLWSVPAADAIHLAATGHGEFITLVGGERPSFLMVGNNDEVYDKKPQRLGVIIDKTLKSSSVQKRQVLPMQC